MIREKNLVPGAIVIRHRPVHGDDGKGVKTAWMIVGSMMGAERRYNKKPARVAFYDIVLLRFGDHGLDAGPALITVNMLLEEGATFTVWTKHEWNEWKP